MAELADRSSPNLIERALDAIDRENSRTRAERDAFREFRDRVEDLAPTSPTTAHGPAAVSPAPTSTGGFRTVRALYESTVMAVPHYEEEYDESYTEHVHEEFGPDITTILVHGTAFERRHKQAILHAADESIQNRERLLEALQRERESVTALRETISSLATDIKNIEHGAAGDASARLLDGYLSRLEVLERQCHDLVDQRQSEMVTERRELRLPISGPDIPTYLYTDLPVSYPIISILTELIDTARSTQRTLEARMGHRSGDTETETAMRE